MKTNLFLILFVLILSATSLPAQELILEKGVAPHAKIDDVYRRFSEAYKKLDSEAVTNLYTDDAFYLSPGSDVKRGREKVSAEFTRYFDSVRKSGGSLSISFQILDRGVSADLAYDVGIFTVTQKDAKGEARSGRGKFVVVAKRQKDGGWRFSVDTYSDLPKVQNTSSSINARNSENLFLRVFAD